MIDYIYKKSIQLIHVMWFLVGFGCASSNIYLAVISFAVAVACDVCVTLAVSKIHASTGYNECVLRRARVGQVDSRMSSSSSSYSAEHTSIQ